MHAEAAGRRLGVRVQRLDVFDGICAIGIEADPPIAEHEADAITLAIFECSKSIVE
ncbi:MAG: hypothetical protein V4529_16875 [Gemmatimonadota bacterium]